MKKTTKLICMHKNAKQNRLISRERVKINHKWTKRLVYFDCKNYLKFWELVAANGEKKI